MIAVAACDGSNGPTPPTTPTGGSTFTVTIANNAVSPQSLSVPRGSRVTFVNNDSRTHEIDSDPHPTHTDCPEINQIGFLSPGQSHETAALNLYSTRAGAFRPSDEAIGVLLASHGALAMAAADARSKSHNLTIALNNAREIGIGIGVLMNSMKITRDQAFDLLRIVSQHSHRKLADIAVEVAHTGALPELPRR